MASIEYAAKEKFFVFQSFVDNDDLQRLIAEEALKCHSRNEELKGNNQVDGMDMDSISSSKASLKLNLGIPCGGDLNCILPNAVAVARRAFEQAASVTKSKSTAKTLGMIATGPLSGLSPLYGVDAIMLPHYDSPTQPGQREEWLCMMSFGNTMVFRCDDEILSIQSGDVLVMDAMATLHGVERIVPDINVPPMCSRIGFPMPQVRLGILFWQGRLVPVHNDDNYGEKDVNFEAFTDLFGANEDE